MENQDTVTQKECPSCGNLLALGGSFCRKCGWSRERTRERRMDSMSEVDKRAAFLNLIPGLGHIYKGHLFSGMAFMFLGLPFTLVAAMLLLITTAGLSLLLPILFWAWLIFEVIEIEDRPGFRHKVLRKFARYSSI